MILERALADTYSGKIKASIFSLIGFAASFFIFQYFIGKSAAIDELKTWIIGIGGAAFSLFCLLIYNIIITPYRLQSIEIHRMHSKSKSLEEENIELKSHIDKLKQNRPDLVLQIENVAFSNSTPENFLPDHHMLTLFCSIRNKGTLASSVAKWELRTLSNGQSEKLKGMEIRGYVNFDLNNIMYRLQEDNQIYKKSIEPISAGSVIYGFFMCQIHKDILFFEGDSRIEIDIEDVYGNINSKQENIRSENNIDMPFFSHPSTRIADKDT